MATAKSPLSDAAEARNNMLMQTMSRMQHRAYRALHVLGHSNNEIVVVCIEVDSRWRDLVEHLMPGQEQQWQAQRDASMEPVAIGSVSWALVPWLAKEFPDIEDVINAVPEEGIVKGVVLNDGGCTIVDVEPKEEAEV